MKLNFTSTLLHWHTHSNTREMPWKGEKDPYKIWLSEMILQQTRVEQGLAYYNKFTQAYPTVFDLAKAKDQTVFKLWEGLGYYNRCRNLLATAKETKTPEEKEFLKTSMSNFMKKLYLSHNTDAVENHVIAENLKELSRGELVLDNPDELTSTNTLLRSMGMNNGQKRTIPNNNKNNSYKQKQKKKFKKI